MINPKIAILLAALTLALPLSAAEPPKPPPDPQKLQDMEVEQRRLHSELKEKLGSLPDSPKKEELKRLLAEIERRMNAQGPGKAYLSPAANFTPEMRAYYDRLIAKIEHCGTQHLPQRNGKTAYGKGLVAITLDKAGKLLESEILESSRDKLVDAHMRRVVQASSPFGVLPDKLTTDSDRAFASAVVLTRFEFKRDDAPVDPLPGAERCRWK